MEILEGLNDVQTQALQNTRGAVLVTAGAGSGKTKLLTHRIAYLIKEKNVPQENILAVTFTNKAAREMSERVAKLTNGESYVFISTFHSMCLRILRMHIDKLGQGFSKAFSIYDDNDSEKTLKQVLKDCNIPVEEYRKFASIISACNNENVDIYTYQKQKREKDSEVELVYETYEKTLEKNNALDFDHLLTKTYELFATKPEVLNIYAQRFEYIFVDEFQDTNKVQYDIIKQLSSVHKNIFAVGDEDQCIYTWRGANFRNIFNFKKDFAPVALYKLEQNYRSTKKILDRANMVIKNNSERFDKVLWTDNETGDDVVCNQYYDEQEEAENVISKIVRLKSQGYKNSDIAVLMRINALSLSFEKKFLNYNIPYKVYGGFKFYERQEIKNVISYLRLFCNPNDDTSLQRIINFPKRAIGDVAIEKLRSYATERGMSLFSGMLNLYEHSIDDFALFEKIKGFVETYYKLRQDYEKVPLDVFCKEVVTMYEIKSAYTEKTEENTERIMNIDVFVNSVKDYVHENGNSATLDQFLESITLESDLDFLGEEDSVILTTIHSVKGLEFKVVFVVGLEEGIFPLSRSTSNQSEMEEERRLMYVAMTRAKEKLYLSHVKTRYLHGRRSYTTPSRFLAEAHLVSPTRPRDGLNSYYGLNAYKDYDSTKKPKTVEKAKSYTKSVGGYTKAQTITNQDNSNLRHPKTDYKAGQEVIHPKFGHGKIMAIVDNGDCGEIIFDKYGKKTLILEIAPLEIIGE